MAGKLLCQHYSNKMMFPFSSISKTQDPEDLKIFRLSRFLKIMQLDVVVHINNYFCFEAFDNTFICELAIKNVDLLLMLLRDSKRQQVCKLLRILTINFTYKTNSPN